MAGIRNTAAYEKAALVIGSETMREFTQGFSERINGIHASDGLQGLAYHVSLWAEEFISEERPENEDEYIGAARTFVNSKF